MFAEGHFSYPTCFAGLGDSPATPPVGLLETVELLICSSPRAPVSQHRSSFSSNLVEASRKLFSHFILIPYIMSKHVVPWEIPPPCTW